ncbi:hypothetical protein JB92DRAFT_3096966 [Gautieria morchelliformis]|nr:hypothetical protein JB92DRAFT_3096966 [Gautieria morchelliformis]
MDVPRPNVLFENTTPTAMPIQKAITNLLVQNSVTVVVVEVEFRKMSSAPYHEFLVFKVEDSRYSPTAIIVVDRYVGDITDEELWRCAIPADSDEPELKYTSLGRLTFVNVPSELYVKEHREGSFVCKKFSTRKPTLTVAELLILIHAVYQQNHSYHLLQHQCYWFVDVLYNAAKEKCGAWVTADQRIKDIGLATKQYTKPLKEEREAKQKAEAAAQRADEEIKQLKRLRQISEANNASSGR